MECIAVYISKLSLIRRCLLLREVPLYCDLFYPIQSNLIDDSTGLTGTHEELSALSKEHTQVFTMSMWDIQRKFRYILKKVTCTYMY